MFSISSEVIHLETLPTLPLEHLSLSAKKLTGCPSLVRFKSTLKKLRVTRISFFDCEDLLGLRLEKLSLTSNVLSNTSRLGEIDLSYLQLRTSGFTEEQLLYLKNALPNCHISQ